MPQLEYLGGSAEVYVPSASVTAKRGEPVDVPDAVAGRAPSGDDDPGEGLLAQVDLWRLAAPKSADRTPKER